MVPPDPGHLLLLLLLQWWHQHPFLNEEKGKGSGACPGACCSTYDDNSSNDEASCASYNHSCADDATCSANGHYDNPAFLRGTEPWSTCTEDQMIDHSEP